MHADVKEDHDKECRVQMPKRYVSSSRYVPPVCVCSSTAVPNPPRGAKERIGSAFPAKITKFHRGREPVSTKLAGEFKKKRKKKDNAHNSLILAKKPRDQSNRGGTDHMDRLPKLILNIDI